MNEIYWITRFDYFQGILIASLILIGAVVAIAAACYCSDDNVSSDAKGVLKWSIPSFVMALLALCFIPSTNEAMLIYGIGGTIDYIKSNDKAKQLPDKCIDALTRYVDSIEKENTESKK